MQPSVKVMPVFGRKKVGTTVAPKTELPTKTKKPISKGKKGLLKRDEGPNVADSENLVADETAESVSSETHSLHNSQSTKVTDTTDTSKPLGGEAAATSKDNSDGLTSNTVDKKKKNTAGTLIKKQKMQNGQDGKQQGTDHNKMEKGTHVADKKKLKAEKKLEQERKKGEQEQRKAEREQEKIEKELRMIEREFIKQEAEEKKRVKAQHAVSTKPLVDTKLDERNEFQIFNVLEDLQVLGQRNTSDTVCVLEGDPAQEGSPTAAIPDEAACPREEAHLIGAPEGEGRERQVGAGEGQVGAGEGQVGAGEGQVGAGERQVGAGERQVGAGEGQVGAGEGQVGAGPIEEAAIPTEESHAVPCEQSGTCKNEPASANRPVIKPSFKPVKNSRKLAERCVTSHLDEKDTTGKLKKAPAERKKQSALDGKDELLRRAKNKPPTASATVGKGTSSGPSPTARAASEPTVAGGGGTSSSKGGTTNGPADAGITSGLFVSKEGSPGEKEGCGAGKKHKVSAGASGKGVGKALANTSETLHPKRSTTGSKNSERIKQVDKFFGKPRKRKADCGNVPLSASKKAKKSSHSGPVWVQCDDCRKWRMLKDCLDPCEVPDKWVCSMNKGTNKQKKK